MGDQVAWFLRPGAEAEGTLNATYQLLDRAVIAGRSDEPVLEDGTSHARLLQQAAAFGGALRGFGVEPGDRVLVDLPVGVEAVLALFAAARVGAVAVVVPGSLAADEMARALDATVPKVVVTADDVAVGLALADAEHVPEAVVVAGESSGEAVPWEVVMRAGETDPAPAVAVAADSPSTVVWPRAGEDVRLRTTLHLARQLGEVADVAPLATADLVELLRGPTIGE